MLYDQIIAKSKAIEALLHRLGCTGKGIHELLTDAGDRIPSDIVKSARKVATIRNKAIHETGYSLDEIGLRDFCINADFVIRELERIQATGGAWASKDPSAGVVIHYTASSRSDPNIWKAAGAVAAFGAALATAAFKIFD